jgi:hypothetical protein
MKILSAMTALDSENQFESLDLSLHKETRQRRVFKQSSRQTSRWMNQGMDREDSAADRVLVDRVSIEQQRSQSYQSNYSTQVSARSQVSFVDSASTVVHSQKRAIEEIIGGVIDKQVVVTAIEQNRDVALPTKKTSGPKILGNKTGQISAQELSIHRTDIHFEDQATRFSATGQVTTEDGRHVDFSLDVSMDRTFLSRKEEALMISRWQESVVLTDPLVVSLDGQAPELTDTRFTFDLDADGKNEEISFVRSGSGFLALDKNNDEKINDGSELFGPGTGNGFEELAAFDLDQNNWIDENDAVFSQLSVWTKDAQGNDQLTSLKDAGIGAISLDYASTKFNMTQADNTLKGQMQRSGVFLFENGRVGSVHQVDLASERLALETASEGMASVDPAADVSPIQLPAFSPLSTPQPAPAEEPVNPIEELMEQIEKIKEEMEKLYDALDPMRSRGKYKKGRNRKRMDIQIDSSVLLSSLYGQRRARHTNRYI